jgi:hypothetical protein
MRSMVVSARTRRTGAAVMASSSSPPSAWARLCAASRACIPDESQNWVRVMSTTRVPCPCAAASSRADRNSGALVMSISSGAVTTGTPLTTSKGHLPSRICVTSRGCGYGCAERRCSGRRCARAAAWRRVGG